MRTLLVYYVLFSGLSFCHVPFLYPIIQPISPYLLQTQKFFVVSLHKTGTHLATRCLNLLTQKSFLNAQNLDIFDPAEISSLPDNKFYLTHAHCTSRNIQVIQNAHIKGIYIYRDPRDHLVTLTHWIYARPEAWPHLQNLSFDTLLLKLIKHYTTLLPKLRTRTCRSLSDVYTKLYLPWSHQRNIYTTRFEHLVGPQGGGSKELQLKEVNNIARHLGIPLSSRQAYSIAHNLFGSTGTFREGKIGTWKLYFKREHKEAFKRVAGHLLIKLGYEKDFNW